MAARIPVFLQDADIGVQTTPLLTRSSVFGEDIAGHVLTHGLPTELELAGDLDDGLVLSLQPFDLSLPLARKGMTPCLTHDERPLDDRPCLHVRPKPRQRAYRRCP